MLQRQVYPIALALGTAAIAGCLGGPAYAPPPGMAAVQNGQFDPAYPGPLSANNPVFIPCQDPNLIWDQLVDVVDDYFEIQREDRVQMIGGIPTEGRLETVPRGSSTIFEPWNNDSVTPYERWEATLQSTRRTCNIRVIPVPEGGYLVEVIVAKELEEVAQPDAVFVGDESLRNDNSIRRFSNNANGGGVSLGWIPKGRDVALEQEIIWQLQSRFAAPPGSQVPVFMSQNPPAQPATAAEWKPVNSDATTKR